MKIELSNRVHSDKTFEVSQLSLNRILQDRPKVMTLSLPMEGATKDFELTESQIFSDDFVVKNEFGEIMNVDLGVHYKGKVIGSEKSVVCFTFSEDGIHGLVHGDSGIYDLKKINDNNHGFFQVSQEYDYSCGVIDEGHNQTPSTYSVQNIPQSLPMGLNPYVTSIANFCLKAFWEVDFDIYSLHTGNTVSYITSLFNASKTLFENDGIFVVLSEMKVWTTGYAPYRTYGSPVARCDCGSFLTNYRAYYVNNSLTFNGDFAHILTYNFPCSGDVSSGGRCGVSYVNAPCGSFKYCMSQLYYTNVLGSSTVYSWNVNVITHEQGHQFGSQHTHACVWNGNNTAIDSCAPVEGSCPAPGYPPPGGGTIMSYCHQVSSVKINFANGFGPQPQQRIVNSINAKTCLQACAPPPQTPSPTPTTTPTPTFGLTPSPTSTKTPTPTPTPTFNFICKPSTRFSPPYTGGTITVSGATFSSIYSGDTSTQISNFLDCISTIPSGLIDGPELGGNALPFSYTLISDTPLNYVIMRVGNIRPNTVLDIIPDTGTVTLSVCGGCCAKIVNNQLVYGDCDYTTTLYGTIVAIQSSSSFTKLTLTGSNPFPRYYGIIFDVINFKVADLNITQTPTMTKTPTPTPTITLGLVQPTQTPTPTLCNFYGCNTAIIPPAILNGISITSTLIGQVLSTPVSQSSCGGSVVIPPNTLNFGYYGPNTYTLNFSPPISNIVIYMQGAGLQDFNCSETFTFTTNSGNPTISSTVNCFATINNNVITFNTFAAGTGGGGGIFLISNITPFSTLTMVTTGGCAGTYVAFCSESLICSITPTPTKTPTPTQTPTLTKTSSQTPSITPTSCCSKFTLTSSPNDSNGSNFLITNCDGSTQVVNVPNNTSIEYNCAKLVSLQSGLGSFIRYPGCVCTTPSPTSTPTLTPTSTVQFPSVGVLLLYNLDVYKYDVTTNTQTFLTTLAFSGSSFFDTNDITHTNSKIFVKGYVGIDFNDPLAFPAIGEWNYTLNPFTITFVRFIELPDLLASYPGLFAVNNTTLITSSDTDNTPNQIIRIDISGPTPIFNSIVQFPYGYRTFGDYIVTTTNKLIVIVVDFITKNTFIYQYDYNNLLLGPEIIKSTGNQFEGRYLFESNSKLYLVNNSLSSELYEIGLTYPYNLTFVNNLDFSFYSGASNTYLESNVNLILITPTSTPTPTLTPTQNTTECQYCISLHPCTFNKFFVGCCEPYDTYRIYLIPNNVASSLIDGQSYYVESIGFSGCAIYDSALTTANFSYQYINITPQ